MRPKITGAICPSSAALCRTITDKIGIEKASVIAELGPGTGVITGHIIRRKSDEASFFAVELNSSMYELTRDKYPDLTIFHDSASNLRSIMESLKLDKVDVIVSGLPWAAFPESLQCELLDAICDVLPPGGKFVTFAYLQGTLLPAGRKFRCQLGSYFNKIEKSRVVWNNVPPAFVYRCTK